MIQEPCVLARISLHYMMSWKWHSLSEITKVLDNQCNILMASEFFVWTYPGLVWPAVKNFIKFENSFKNDRLPNFQIQVEKIHFHCRNFHALDSKVWNFIKTNRLEKMCIYDSKPLKHFDVEDSSVNRFFRTFLNWVTMKENQSYEC